MSEFLGSRISLISKSDIRYVGTLHEINSDESTVSLENVRSFGTEGRKGKPDEEIAASDQVYEYIVFRGSDVKDLRIEEQPAVKENKPPVMPDDPAILGARRGGPQGPNQTVPPPGSMNQYPPNNFYGGPAPPGNWGRGGPMPPGPGPQFGSMPPYPPPPGWYGPGGPGQGFPGGPGGHGGPGGPGPWQNQPPFPPGGPGPHGGPPQGQDGKQAGGDKAQGQGSGQAPTEPKSLATGSRQPGAAPTPPVESKPSAAAVKAAANGTSTEKQEGQRNNRVQPVMPLPGPGGRPTQAAVQATVAAPNSVQDATNAARAAVAVAMSQLGNSGGNPMDNLTSKVQEMRVNAGRNTNPGRGRGRGGRAAAAKVEVPDADFDFAQSNAKFNKDEVAKDQEADTRDDDASEATEATDSNAPVAYNKSTSFFDNISSEAKDRAESSQKPGGREWRGEEQRRNMETFGQGSVDGGYRNYRGRGRGRGGRGRGGYNRGGRGGNRPQYQAQADQ